jgi:TPR repeat protein
MNQQEASKYFKFAIDIGLHHARYRHAPCLRCGCGVPFDQRESLNYFRLAADNEHADGQMQIVLCSCHGEGKRCSILR